MMMKNGGGECGGWCGSARVVVLAIAVVVVWFAACWGVTEAAHRSCEPRGVVKKTAKGDFCVCDARYHPRGIQMLQFYQNGEPSGRGYNPSCCRHCYCASEVDFKVGRHNGVRNKNKRIELFDAETDNAEIYKDLVFQLAVDDAKAAGVGDFEYLHRDLFPECQISLPETTTTQDAVDVAKAFIASCEKKWKWAQRFHDPRNRNTLLLTSWLNFQPGKVDATAPTCTSVKQLAMWYESAMTLGLYGVVLHDCIPDAVVSVLQSGHIRFERVSLDTSSDIHFRQSPYDVRFVQYHDYLQRVADREGRHFDHILMTDMNDVRFRRDPFSAMRARPDIEIFIGQDQYPYSNNPYAWETLEWCADAYGQLPHEGWFGERMAVHPGVVGGKGLAVLRVLKHVVGLYKDRSFRRRWCHEPWERSCDMAMFAIALMTGYETLHEDPWAGEAMGEEPRLRQPYRYDSGPPFTSLNSEFADAHPSYVIFK